MVISRQLFLHHVMPNGHDGDEKGNRRRVDSGIIMQEGEPSAASLTGLDVAAVRRLQAARKFAVGRVAAPTRATRTGAQRRARSFSACRAWLGALGPVEGLLGVHLKGQDVDHGAARARGGHLRGAAAGAFRTSDRHVAGGRHADGCMWSPTALLLGAPIAGDPQYACACRPKPCNNDDTGVTSCVMSITFHVRMLVAPALVAPALADDRDWPPSRRDGMRRGGLRSPQRQEGAGGGVVVVVVVALVILKDVWVGASLRSLHHKEKFCSTNTEMPTGATVWSNSFS